MNRNRIGKLRKNARRQLRWQKWPGRQSPAEVLEDRTLLATINVTTFADVVANDGEVSLREAISQANGSAAMDEILLSAGTYTLTLTGDAEDGNASGDLDLFTDIVIRGTGADETIIDAGGDSGIGERVMHVSGDGNVTIEQVTIRGGRDIDSAGLQVSGNVGSLTILTDVVVTQNVASRHNGGIGVLADSTVNVMNSTISSNTAGSVGGGIGIAGFLTVVDSTISDNTADFAGGISNFNSSLVVVNSTISGNTAAINSGGIHIFTDGPEGTAEAIILQSTIIGNQQSFLGAVGSQAQNGSTSATVRIGNSILALNTGGSGNIAKNPAASVVSLGNNLADDNGGGLLTAPGDQTSVVVPAIDPVLADNGGPTLTHALVAGSNAIDAGNNLLAVDPGPDGVLGSGGDDVPLTTDQRGVDRIVDGTVDIGAFELLLPKAELSVASAVIQESGGLVSTSVTVTTNLPVIGDQSVQLTITGNGITGTDYAVTDVTFTIPDGESTASVDFIAQDDDLVEGTETATLTISDPSAGLNLGDIVSLGLSIVDDDVAGFTADATSIEVSEFETSVSFSVVLDRAPLSDVVLAVSSDDTSEATVSPATLTFTPSNWDTAQSVTVTGVDDSIVDGDQISTVTLSVDAANSDDAFDSVVDQTVSVTTTDDHEFSLDVDDDGDFVSLTDGILFVRYLAGFSGDSLVSGAVNETGGQRTSAVEIIAWLDPHRTTFIDVDGDGNSTPLGDGILLIRFLAGFRGDSLIAGAVNQAGTRTTAEQVESWLNQFTSGGGSAAAPVANGPVVQHPEFETERERSTIRQRTAVPNPLLTITDKSPAEQSTSYDWRADLQFKDLPSTRAKTDRSPKLDLVFSDAVGLLDRIVGRTERSAVPAFS